MTSSLKVPQQGKRAFGLTCAIHLYTWEVANLLVPFVRVAIVSAHFRHRTTVSAIWCRMPWGGVRKNRKVRDVINYIDECPICGPTVVLKEIRQGRVDHCRQTLYQVQTYTFLGTCYTKKKKKERKRTGVLIFFIGMCNFGSQQWAYNKQTTWRLLAPSRVNIYKRKIKSKSRSRCLDLFKRINTEWLEREKKDANSKHGKISSHTAEARLPRTKGSLRPGFQSHVWLLLFSWRSYYAPFIFLSSASVMLYLRLHQLALSYCKIC